MQDEVQAKSNGGTPRQLEVHIGGDVATLTLNGSLTLNAQQVEDLVASLAMVRARMQPQVSPDPPAASGSEFVLNPRHSVMADPVEGSIFTFIRHPMYGWIALCQSQDEAMRLVLAMAGQLKLLEHDVPGGWTH
ncbi:hypothetical protein [Polaromonas sp.]|uniref:hypothetical protein n=1 Tax=Polaromonas sp. TaxID=1869339 RepID=UPI0032648B79